MPVRKPHPFFPHPPVTCTDSLPPPQLVATSAEVLGSLSFRKRFLQEHGPSEKTHYPASHAKASVSPKMLFICMWVIRNTSRYVFHCASPASYNIRRSTLVCTCTCTVSAAPTDVLYSGHFAPHCTPLFVSLALHTSFMMTLPFMLWYT